MTAPRWWGRLAAGPGRPLTRAEVREVDRRAIEVLGLPGLVLMENAALGLTAAALELLDQLREEGGGAGPVDGEVAVVCGRGNNGGDGLALARHLALLGVAPRVALAARRDDPGARAGDAGVQLGVLERAGVVVDEVLDGAALATWLAGRAAGARLVVDALFGTGLAGPLREPGLGLVRTLDRDPRPKLACDLPSGLDCDTGRPLGAAVRARETVSFVAPKVGFEAPGADAYTGRVRVVPIGCPAAAWAHIVNEVT